MTNLYTNQGQIIKKTKTLQLISLKVKVKPQETKKESRQNTVKKTAQSLTGISESEHILSQDREMWLMVKALHSLHI